MLGAPTGQAEILQISTAACHFPLPGPASARLLSQVLLLCNYFVRDYM